MFDRKVYNEHFHKNRNAETQYAAEKVLAILFEKINIQSVCDVGCGVGTWLKVCSDRFGVKDCYGIDGEYIEGLMQIPKEQFLATDLSNVFRLDKRYDLCISLEVAEHLPASRANSFIQDLSNISDVILFSAAFIKQGGNGHINERTIWYWKKIFRRNGYKCLDVIRPKIYNEIGIASWYRRNAVLFVKKTIQTEELEKLINRRISFRIDCDKMLASIKKELRKRFGRK